MSGLEHLQNLSIQPSNRSTQQQQTNSQPQSQYSQLAAKRRSARDYQFGAKIGEGSYSTVYSALDKYTNRTYAIKVLSKRHIVKENKIKYVNIEKTTLNRLGQQHPGLFNYIILSKMRVACFCFGFCRIWGVVVNH